ncbi:MAG: hypothetical protein JOZ56_09080 [Actinobacteria bacterium]|nr:hypothetical protein [Actinomycetota bacterium]MBV8563229.1 hypothetical protein [Actinomycetota bacterium]
MLLLGAAAARAGTPFHVGVDEDAVVWGDPDLTTGLAKENGFDWIRMSVQWTSGELSLPLAQLMRVQRAATAGYLRGVQPVLAIYNANWRSTPADPASQAQFVRFVQSVVTAVPATAYVIGNEANSNLYWWPQFDAQGNDLVAPAYERLLASSYDAIKAIRPSALVIGGALDPRGNDWGGPRLSHSPTTFIRDLGAAYRASGRQAPIMDVFDEHGYEDTSSLPPAMTHPHSTTISVDDYGKLVALLGAAFDGTAQKGSTLPILYGEFGVETSVPPALAGVYTGTQIQGWTQVDPATQAAYYAQALKIAMCQPNVIGLMLFHLTDERDLVGWQSGLYYANGMAKPSQPAIAAAVQAARAGTLTSCPDRTPPAVSVAPPSPDGTVTVTASDDVGVGGVWLTLGKRSLGVRYAAPYVFRLRGLRPGRYRLRARAVDAAGNVAASTLSVVLR